MNNSQRFSAQIFAPLGGARRARSGRFVLGILAASILFNAPALAEEKTKEAEVEITEKARRHFRAGAAFAEDPDGARYADALREFRRAYAESPSWKVLGNLGLAAMKLERDGEAIEAFRTYLEEGGDELETAERAQFERDLEMLESSVTWVTISTNVKGATLLDRRSPLSGQAILNQYPVSESSVRIGLHSGRHRLTLSLDGYESASWTLDASGGEKEHTLELSPVKEDEPAPAAQPVAVATPEDKGVTTRPVPTSVWIGVGATGLLGIGAGVTGIIATGKRSDFDAANDGSDPTGADEIKKQGETLNLVTDVLLGGTIVAAAVTTYLYVTRPEVEKKKTALILSPVALPHGGGLWMQGNF